MKAVPKKAALVPNGMLRAADPDPAQWVADMAPQAWLSGTSVNYLASPNNAVSYSAAALTTGR